MQCNPSNFDMRTLLRPNRTYGPLTRVAPNKSSFFIGHKVLLFHRRFGRTWHAHQQKRRKSIKWWIDDLRVRTQRDTPEEIRAEIMAVENLVLIIVSKIVQATDDDWK